MLRQLLDFGGIAYRDRGKNVGRGFINICCPFCGEERYHCGIHEHDLWFNCWVCGAKGQWYRIKRKLGDLYPGVAWDSVRADDSAMFVGERENKACAEPIYRDVVLPDDLPIVSWLTDEPRMDEIGSSDRPRGLLQQAIDDVDIKVGIGRLRGYVVFPEGRNVVARKFAPSVAGARWWQRVEEPPFLYGSVWIERLKPRHAVVTEGIFDLLRLPLGSGLAVLGSTFSDDSVAAIANVLKGCDSVMLAFDRDVNIDRLSAVRLALADLGVKVDCVDWGQFDADIKDLDDVALNYTHERAWNFCGLSGDAEVDFARIIDGGGSDGH